MKKPRVITACVANHHAAEGERIAEFSFFDGTGGLISFRQPTIDRPGRVEVYRTDGAVLVVAPQTERERELEAALLRLVEWTDAGCDPSAPSLRVARALLGLTE